MEHHPTSPAGNINEIPGCSHQGATSHSLDSSSNVGIIEEISSASAGNRDEIPGPSQQVRTGVSLDSSSIDGTISNESFSVESVV